MPEFRSAILFIYIWKSRNHWSISIELGNLIKWSNRRVYRVFSCHSIDFVKFNGFNESFFFWKQWCASVLVCKCKKSTIGNSYLSVEFSCEYDSFRVLIWWIVLVNLYHLLWVFHWRSIRVAMCQPISLSSLGILLWVNYSWNLSCFYVTSYLFKYCRWRILN